MSPLQRFQRWAKRHPVVVDWVIWPALFVVVFVAMTVVLVWLTPAGIVR